MRIFKDGRVVDDPWIPVDDDAVLPDGAPALISLARWRADRAALSRRNARLGLRLASAEPPGQVAEDLDRFALIALEFPAFTDGRAYSTARLLRQRYGYTGELRAVGNVLRDQLLFMQRCGFDTYECPDAEVADAATADWNGAFEEIDVVYQAAADRRRPAAELRAAAA